MGSLGAYLKKKRLESGYTQLEIGTSVGVSIQYVSNVERGVCFPSRGRVGVWAEMIGANKSRVLKEILTCYRKMYRNALNI